MAQQDDFWQRLTDSQWFDDWLDDSLSAWWSGIKFWLPGLLVVAALVGASYLFYNILVYNWPIKSGLDEFIPPQPKPEGYERAKTLWDWLQLLVIPVVLAIAGFFLNQTERINAEKASLQRAETEQKIAAQRAETEQRIAAQHAQESVLEEYLDRMTDLLIVKQLIKSQPGSEVRNIARIRTLTTLRRLDGERNKVLIQFLFDASVLVDGIDPDNSVIDMRRSNLGGVNLSEVNLPGIDLSEADLRAAYLDKANLSRANLSEANLQAADLHEAKLQQAKLRRTKLQKANLCAADLCEANLRGADLEGANLYGANLRGADLREANLCSVDLRGADLHKAKLQGAKLEKAKLRLVSFEGADLRAAHLGGADLDGANLSGTNLFGADLREVNLQDANLYGANLRSANLRGASLERAAIYGANLPDGSSSSEPEQFLAELLDAG